MVMKNEAWGSANGKELERLQQILDQLPQRVLRRGFFGQIEIIAEVQDGVIQHSHALLKVRLKKAADIYVVWTILG